MKNNKEELRGYYLQTRRDLTHDYIVKNQQVIDQKSIEYLKKNNPKVITIYYAIKGENEVDTTNIISYCLDHQIKVYLPRWNHLGMDFYRIDKMSDLISTNNYYMPLKENKLSSDELVDIMFIPLVAIDKNNNRIGYGAGYYDKWINEHEKQIKQLVGLAWDKQITNELIDSESHDKPLDCVIIN